MKFYLRILTILYVAVFSLTAQTFTSSNLPIVIIDTHGQTIVNEPKITVDMKIIDNGEGKRNSLTDTVYNYNGLIGIEIRGSSSQMFPKKQYGFETRDSSGEDIKVSLLGMPSESDWILSAQYNDKTLMRDVITYWISNSIGRYASRTRYCELVLNGQYWGVYMLFEKIKRDKNRVNISKLDETGTSGDALSGGYIIKVDKLDGSDNDGWYSTYPPFDGTTKKILYQYHYPKPKDILDVQKLYIKNFMLAFENIMDSPSYADTVNGYPKLLDVSSAVDFFLVNELTRNVDAYRLSAFMYKDKDSKGGKLVQGPYWDFNHGFGNCNYYDAYKTSGWQLSYFSTKDSFKTADEFQPPFWWRKLYQDSTFMKKVKARWISLRQKTLALQNIYGFIDSVSALINEAQQRNFVRWPILNQYVWPNVYIGGSYANEITYLKTWMKNRFDWMDTELAGRSLSVESNERSLPLNFELFQNYPNPFNPSTTITFTIPPAGASHQTFLRVYDLLGKEVATLVNEEKSSGTYSVRFEAQGLPSGVYFFRLQWGKNIQTKKMTLLQ